MSLEVVCAMSEKGQKCSKLGKRQQTTGKIVILQVDINMRDAGRLRGGEEDRVEGKSTMCDRNRGTCNEKTGGRGEADRYNDS